MGLSPSAAVKFTSSTSSSDGSLVTSVIPTCSADSATVEVVPRSYVDIRSEDSSHDSLLIRIDYICVREDGQQVSHYSDMGAHIYGQEM